MKPRESGSSYWIGVVSRDHVARGVAGGFAQLNHGKAGPLTRMQPGDGLAYYSPRTHFPDGEPLQAFTAIGRVAAGTVYESRDGGEVLFRRKVDYLPAAEAPIRPLLDDLSFIRSKTHWGAAFRFGVVRVPAEDFSRIAAAMGCDLALAFATSVST
ncbi:MAG: EVE domain-containing protein [Burkholderiales bacterium]